MNHRDPSANVIWKTEAPSLVNLFIPDGTKSKGRLARK